MSTQSKTALALDKRDLPSRITNAILESGLTITEIKNADLALLRKHFPRFSDLLNIYSQFKTATEMDKFIDSYKDNPVAFTLGVLEYSCGQVSTPGRKGSGFFVGDEFFLTCAHVVKDEESPKIIHNGTGSLLNPIRLYVDEKTDIAVLHVPDFDLPTITLNESHIGIGTKFVVGGYPSGYEMFLIQQGIVSGVYNRNIYLDKNTFSGMSGSPIIALDDDPLLTSEGLKMLSCIGMVTGHLISPEATAVGFGIGVGSDKIREIVAEAKRIKIQRDNRGIHVDDELDTLLVDADELLYFQDAYEDIKLSCNPNLQVWPTDAYHAFIHEAYSFLEKVVVQLLEYKVGGGRFYISSNIVYTYFEETEGWVEIPIIHLVPKDN